MKSLAVVLTMLAVSTSPAVGQTQPPQSPAPAAEIARPASDSERDAARKPAALLAFAGVEAGDTVVDFIMGGGYWTRVLAEAVGPKGRVIAYQPSEFIAFRAAYGNEQDEAVKGRTNVTPSRVSLAKFAVPVQADAIITVQNYHDFHLKQVPAGAAAAINASIFKALKPGGTLVVVDHAAPAGAPLTVADTLHRIDPAVVRAEVEKAGFVYEAESTEWANTTDPMTTLVFSPSIRGKTNQFAYRFRKPL